MTTTPWRLPFSRPFEDDEVDAELARVRAHGFDAVAAYIATRVAVAADARRDRRATLRAPASSLAFPRRRRGRRTCRRPVENGAVGQSRVAPRSCCATRATTARWRRRRAETRPDSSAPERDSLPSRDSPLEHAASRTAATSSGKARMLHRQRDSRRSPISPRKRRAVALSYGSYLKVDELLGLQQPLSRPPHHDEMLFIIIHQVYELWFKQLLHEVDATMAALDRDDLLRVAKHFRRIHTIQRLLEQQVDILETMTPQEFNQFRDNLNPGQRLSIGAVPRARVRVRRAADRSCCKRIELDDAQRARLGTRASASRRSTTASKRCCARRGFRRRFERGAGRELPPDLHRRSRDTTISILLLEDLIEFDERFLLWRGRHVRMVERMIGQKQGTGGSPGARISRGHARASLLSRAVGSAHATSAKERYA